MGHLYRGFFIQAELQKQFGIQTSFIVKGDEQVEHFLNTKKLDYIVIPDLASTDEEIGLLGTILPDLEPDLAFLDVLENDISERYTTLFKNNTQLLIAITDDSLRGDINAHIVVNGNPNQNPAFYEELSGDYYVGPRYFIMDPDYARIETDRPQGGPKKILVSLGGTDHHNLLFKVLDAIDAKYQIDIITSKNTGYLKRLKDYLTQRATLQYNCYSDVASLAGYWTQADVAITAGGNTLFERIATRLPGATVCQLERQMEIAEKFQDMGVNANIGYGPSLAAEQLSKGIEDFLNDRNTHRRQYETAPEVLRGEGLELLMHSINIKMRAKRERL